MVSSDKNSGKAIVVKSHDEILIMQEANQIVAETLVLLKKKCEPRNNNLGIGPHSRGFL